MAVDPSGGKFQERYPFVMAGLDPAIHVFA
jgi:hypothetical protein